jgi:hypothetical protein
MWLLIKIIITVIAFVIRFFGKHFQRKSSFDREFEGVPYLVKEHRNKTNITATDIKIPFECGSVFKITKEGSLDRLFKTLGLAEEFQTGDEAFDQSYYLATDCSAFRAEVKLDQATRKLVKEQFLLGCDYIFCDGFTLTIRYKGSLPVPEINAAEAAIKLFRQISDLGRFKPQFISDRFQFKVLIIEGLIWSLAAYAFTGFFEFMWFPEDIHIYKSQIFQKGLVLGSFAAVFLLFLIFLFIRGSSRSHRILIESFFVLCFSLPLGGVNFASDLNTHLDKSETKVLQAKVTDRFFRVKRTRKGGTTTKYYLSVKLENPQPYENFPSTLQISYDKYNQMAGAKEVELRIGKGYLDSPWIKKINRTDF